MRYKHLMNFGVGILTLGLALFACDGDEDSENDVPTNPSPDSGTDPDQDPDSGTDPDQDPDSGTDPDRDQDEDLDNLFQVVEAAGLTALTTALTDADLAETISTAEELTVFAPSNAAIATAALPQDINLLTNILLHHVVGKKLFSQEVFDAPELRTLGHTTLPKEGTTINGVDIREATLDVKASNGVAHVIDTVFLPPTILEQLVAAENFSAVHEAVDAAEPELTDILSGDEPLTFFVPSNAALEAFLGGGERPDAETLTKLLRYHVVEGQYLLEDLRPGELTTLHGSNIRVDIDDDTMTLVDRIGNEVSVQSEAGIRLLNGVIHVIDGVLSPPDMEERTIAELVAEDSDLSTLAGLLNQVGLDEVLGASGTYTVFGPSNAALQAVNGEEWLNSDALITNVLLHHVLDTVESLEAVNADNFTRTTLAGTTVTTTVSPSGRLRVGGATLTPDLPAIDARNGLVHRLDGLMRPPTVFEFITQQEDLSRMETNVATIEEVIGVLFESGPVTVFAPNDAAFAALQGTPDLETLISYHVVSTGQLLETQTATTAQGGTVDLIIDGDTQIVDDGSGTPAQILDTARLLNGVVHIIDRVLEP